VIRKDYIQKQVFNIGDVVYLIHTASSPNQWTIKNIMDKNIILENVGTGMAKVVSEDEITHTPPAQQISGGNITRPSQVGGEVPSGITFAPNIIISSGDNSQITAPSPSTSLIPSSATNLVSSDAPSDATNLVPSSAPSSGQLDFDKPMIKTNATEEAPSAPSIETLSSGGFVVKKV